MLRALHSLIFHIYMIRAVLDLNIYIAFASLGSHKISEMLILFEKTR